MNPLHRFRDENKRLSDFYDEVWVVCPSCEGKAIATADRANYSARLFCGGCGYNKELHLSKSATLITAAHFYFDVPFWLQAPFRSKQVFFAYNGAHLNYLEQYIAASLRESKDRSHFTLLEKLPRFYHDAKNRTALLRLIQKLREK